jgi:hypothetical protein
MSDYNSPRELLNAYRNGFVGVECDEEDVKKLLGELPMPMFGAAAYELYGAGEHTNFMVLEKVRSVLHLNLY